MISLLGTKRDLGLDAQQVWDVVYEGAKGGWAERQLADGERSSSSGTESGAEGHQVESWAPQVSVCSFVTWGGPLLMLLSVLCPPGEIQGYS